MSLPLAALILLAGCSLDTGANVPDSGVSADSSIDGNLDRDTATVDSSMVDAFPGDTSTRDSSRTDTSIADSAVVDTSVPRDAGAELLIEAEDYDRDFSTDGVYSWQFEASQAGYRGRGYTLALPNDRFTRCDMDVIASCGARVEYDFTVPAAGTYHFHFRTWARDFGRDSVFWGFTIDDAQDLAVSSDGSWRWHVGGPRSLTAGSHTLTLWMRENGLRVDQIFITGSGASPP